MKSFCFLPSHSRSHKLLSFCTKDQQVFIKREDELGTLSIGVKIRKFLSLIPFFQSKRIKVAITGSLYSNNTLALSLLCKQYRIPYILVLDRPSHLKKEGNAFFLLLANDEKDIIWIDESFPIEKAKNEYPEHYWLPIGSSCQEALAGSMTIAQDIKNNEQELGLKFDHIFTDAGTGFSASALHLALAQQNSFCHLHVVQVAGKKDDFTKMHNSIFSIMDLSHEYVIPPLHHYIPSSSRAFGSISKKLLTFIRDFAREEGIFLDPLYNAKLFLTARQKIEELSLKGNILIIHSGGTLSLSGFTHLF